MTFFNQAIQDCSAQYGLLN